MTQVVSLSFYRFEGVFARLWAFAMMGLARRSMSRVAGIGFWKLCGSGTGEGFTPRPNFGVYAILCTWPDLAAARAAQATAPVFAGYAARASEHWTLYMTTDSVRGAWSGETPFVPGAGRSDVPLAALTRATIKPSILARFWRRVPDISAVIGRDPNVVFKIGIGEVPWLHQVTFSIWPDAARMADFARTGPHAEAIRAVRTEGWFREELYARFSLLDEDGTWGGTSPLQQLERP
ncbi:spheroidene monooxygenase (plasmid) [Sulfitobacter alexandrii]|uniref:Spheroidene monooxygenase n=1 Tax=Sulfitobacter alexandrii TaxID=1917485 RepID=A0A1J0WN48_9RHOB|nr:spheroidene monooxygenase [Sulfitobacter alexandrii]APE45730.1 spheroidene monooxygenase [Sulfitobacter alexandrii]